MSKRDIVSFDELKRIFYKIDGKSYKNYKVLGKIIIAFNGIKAYFTKIQSDPHAPPSIIEILVTGKAHGFPKEALRENLVPFTDYLARVLYTSTLRYRRKCGTGYSCYIGIPKPSPRILRRSCVDVDKDNLIIRLFVGLPARGRRINGEQAFILVGKNIPRIIEEIISLSGDFEKINEHITLYKDQEYLRKWLYENDYIFFIGEDSILPRESNLSERPLKSAIPFKAPDTLKVAIKLPSGKKITGMAVKKGLIVITGGGYHGKTTLLEAIQDGIYNHILGDGREYVVSRKYTILVKAEDGRIASNVDISSFISKLPLGVDTKRYSSLDSSGSTSMAASINEAIEAGAEVLLIDEDTSATNLLYKDDLMKRIIVREPIKPLCYQARDLIEKTGTSIVVVSSASAAFLNIADKIILMDNYIPVDITSKVKELIRKENSDFIEYSLPKRRLFCGIKNLRKIKARGYKIYAKYIDGQEFELDLSYNPRIVEKGQVKLIAHIIKKLSKLKKPMYVKDMVKLIDNLLIKDGFSAFVNPVPPDLTIVDGFDVVWTLNRFYKAVFIQD